MSRRGKTRKPRWVIPKRGFHFFTNAFDGLTYDGYHCGFDLAPSREYPKTIAVCETKGKSATVTPIVMISDAKKLADFYSMALRLMKDANINWDITPSPPASEAHQG